MTRIAIEPSAELEAFVRDQAAKLEQRPGEYIQLVLRAVQLAHDGDPALLGLLVPLATLRELVFGGTPPAPATPVPRGGTTTDLIDDALDDYA